MDERAKKKMCKEMKRNRLWKKGEGGSLMHDNVPASFGLVKGARRDAYTHVSQTRHEQYNIYYLYSHTNR